MFVNWEGMGEIEPRKKKKEQVERRRKSMKEKDCRSTWQLLSCKWKERASLNTSVEA